MKGAWTSPTTIQPRTQDAAPLFSAPTSTTVFNVLILLSLAVPLLIYFIHTFFTTNNIWLLFIFLVPLIGGLAGTHVFATAYLYFDRDLSVGVPNQRLKLYLVPIALVALNILAVTAMPLGLLMWFMVIYVHYALFHFGRQNIGVLNFSFLSTRRLSVLPEEKLILNAVTLCGMLAALKLFVPGLMLDPNKYHFDLAPLESVIPVLYGLGMLLYVVVVVYGAIHFLGHRSRFGGYRTAVYWMCVFWYAPIYLFPSYPMLNFALFTTSHGLQYLVFLGFHAYSVSCVRARASSAFKEDQRPLALTVAVSLLPAMLLTGSMVVAWWMWSNQGTLLQGASRMIDRIIADDGVFKVGSGLILGLTLAHYWVDQHIWKFNNPERRKWLLQRYPFLAAIQAS
jgi:hypothetical protein